jgi:hypothetical protein
MGTWGVKTFENDGSLDWLYTLEECDDTSALEDALNPEDVNDLDATDGEMILAASEVILGILKSPREGLPEEAIKWIKSHKKLEVSPLVSRAVNLIGKVIEKDSELKELWEENEEDFPKWKEDVEDLLLKLKD